MKTLRSFIITGCLLISSMAFATPAMNIVAASHGIGSYNVPQKVAFNTEEGRLYHVTAYSSFGVATVCMVFSWSLESDLQYIGFTEERNFNIRAYNPTTEILLCFPKYDEDVVFIGVK